MLFVRISIIILVPRIIAGIVSAGLNGRTVQPRIAAAQRALSLVTQLAEFNLLLVFQFMAGIGIFTIRLPALRQVVILALMQRVDLVIEIDLKIFARVLKFRLTR